MGQEIDNSRFTHADFQRFGERLRQETAVLQTWFQQQRFAADPSTVGFELEAWLVNEAGRPAPINQAYLDYLDNPLVVPELSVFNVELNTPERLLTGGALRQLHTALADLWQQCNHSAKTFNAALAMIGILPTVREQELTLASMSRLQRYRALNEQVLRMRRGKPLKLDIHGVEALCTEHSDVMLEAATTSFQLHLQVQIQEAAAFFNTALIVSAPLVAAAANSPYLFGKDLWDETRIPLFEQAVAVGGDIAGDKRAYRRVTFGSGYVGASLLELFLENLKHYPLLLPECLDESLDHLYHLRLHNGTIWRWNRPLVGFGKDGTPHIRIEHRVLPAGPSIADMIANAALFYGLIHALVRLTPAPHHALSFVQSRANFYRAARDGLKAEIVWLDNNRVSARRLLLETLIPLAKQGLDGLDIAKTDIDNYLGIVEARVASGQTGAQWQRGFVRRHGHDMQALTAAYLQGQRSGLPVHEWSLN